MTKCARRTHRSGARRRDFACVRASVITVADDGETVASSWSKLSASLKSRLRLRLRNRFAVL